MLPPRPREFPRQANHFENTAMRLALYLIIAVSGASLYLWPPATLSVADPLELFHAWRDAAVALLSIAALALAACGKRSASPSAGSAPSISTARSPSADAEVAQLVGLLQERGRFVDFLMEDLTGRADAQIGAVARVVHQGCKSVLKEYFDLSPIHEGKEGEQLTLPEPYDPQRYRLLGKVPNQPPFRGKVLHRGWKSAAITLPRVVNAAPGEKVIAPADVEI
jgi:hypothetical protein